MYPFIQKKRAHLQQQLLMNSDKNSSISTARSRQDQNFSFGLQNYNHRKASVARPYREHELNTIQDTTELSELNNDPFVKKFETKEPVRIKKLLEKTKRNKSGINLSVRRHGSPFMVRAD